MYVGNVDEGWEVKRDVAYIMERGVVLFTTSTNMLCSPFNILFFIIIILLLLFRYCLPRALIVSIFFFFFCIFLSSICYIVNYINGPHDVIKVRILVLLFKRYIYGHYDLLVTTNTFDFFFFCIKDNVYFAYMDKSNYENNN